MAVLQSELENNTASREAILAAPMATPPPGTRDWALQELRMYRDANRPPEALHAMMNAETGRLDDIIPYIEHNFNILPATGPVNASKLKNEAQGRNQILEKGASATSAPEVAERNKARTDILQTLMTDPFTEQYLIATYGNPPSGAGVEAMLDRVINSTQYQAKLRNQLKEGMAPVKAVPEAVSQEVLRLEKERAEKGRELKKLKDELSDATSRTSPTGLTKITNDWTNDWATRRPGNEEDTLHNYIGDVGTKETAVATDRADVEAEKANADLLKEQILEAEHIKDAGRVTLLKTQYKTALGKVKAAEIKADGSAKALEVARDLRDKQLLKKAEAEPKRRVLKDRIAVLPGEIKELDEEFRRLDTAYKTAMLPIEQQATALTHELQQAYKKAAAEFMKSNLEETEAARVSLIKDEVDKSKDAASRFVRNQLTKRWSEQKAKRIGRGFTVKPKIDQIRDDYDALINPAQGADYILRDIMVGGRTSIPGLDAFLRSEEKSRGALFSSWSDADRAATMDQWCRANATEVDALRNELAGSILWERRQHGSLIHGKKPLSPSETEYILKQPWGEGSFNDIITKNSNLAELNRRLIASGVERNHLFDWYYKASGGNIAKLLALIFGTAALGIAGGVGAGIGAGALGVQGLAAAGMGASGVGAGGGIIPAILGSNQP